MKKIIKAWAIVKNGKNKKIEMCECHSFEKHMYQIFRTKKIAEETADSNHSAIPVIITYYPPTGE